MLPYLPRRLSSLLALFAIAGLLLTPTPGRPLQAAPANSAALGNVEEWSVGAGLLYWADNCFADEFNPFANLKRKPAGGGAERTLQAINDYGLCNTFRYQLAAADGLYYFDESQGRIERMPLSEPFTPQVVKALDSSQVPLVGGAFVEGGGYLYWGHLPNKIFRTRKDGSSDVETVATTATGLGDLIVVGSTIYWGDSAGIWRASLSCASLPCPPEQISNVSSGARPYGLLYQSLGGAAGNYRIYWVEQSGSGSNTNYHIRYRGCNQIAVCFVLPPPGQEPPPPASFYSSTVNWRIGDLVLANNNLYWTEADLSTVSNSNGDVKRKAYNAGGSGAETIETGQANIDPRLYVANDLLFFARRGNGVYTVPLNAAAIQRDFSADGLEVTQGIQNLANSAPLVANKTTYVRAYARQLSGPSAPNVEARLVGLRNGTPLPGSPLQPINGVRALTTGAGFDRARLNDGWYFQLPASWITAGAISLRLEIDPRQIHSDPNPANNIRTQNVTFQNAPPVCVWTVPVRTHTPLPSTNDPNFFAMIDQFERRWPTPDVWVFRDTNPVEELEVCWAGPFPYPCHGPYELEDGWGLTNGIPDRDKVIVSLWSRALLSFNPDICDDIGAPVHFMGMVHPNANNGGAAGYASTISNQSWVQLPRHTPNPLPASWSAMIEGSVMAQELAHNYGRKHVNCGNPDNIDRNYPYPPCQIANVGADSYYGFDVATLRPIKPNEAADFMSYANPTWVSDYTWRGLLGSLRASSVASLEQAELDQAELDQAELDQAGSVFVTGLVDAEGERGEINSVLVLPSSSMPPATVKALSAQKPALSHQGEPHTSYRLRLLDAGGATLVERTLVLTALDDHSSDGASALFGDLFPRPDGQVAEVQLLAGDVVIDSIRPGTQAPTVTVQQPAAGVVISDTLDLAWRASDPDPDDRLLFTVQYSHDAGASWHTLALNLPSTPDPNHNLRIDDLGSLHGSAPNAARIRVIASDGFNTSIATSQPFTLQNRRPEPVVFSPAAGESFAAGEPVPLRGSATDAEDGGLPAASLSWQVDGVAQGTGPDISAAGLAPGAHTATLRATDSQNQSATRTVSFSVAPLSVPQGAAPILDGVCDDAAYAAGSGLPLRPYAGGDQASLRLLRSADHLWACFSGLATGAPGSAAFAGLRVDINNSRDSQAQANDAGFFVGEDGSVFTRAGDGAGGFGGAGPSGLQAQVSTGPASWSAELRIDRAALGGWDHTIGLSAGHYGLSAPADAYAWPFAADATKPNTWGATALGSQPVIVAIEPFGATAGDAALTLNIAGSGFISGTVVLWNGNPLPTTFVDGERLTAQVAANLLSSPAAVQVSARAPGNFNSNPATFVVAARPPTVSGLSPAKAFVGGPGLTLTVNGSNFAPDAEILWNGQPLATQFVNSGQLKAQISAALLANGQTAGVAVRNRTPDERISSALTFSVEPMSNWLYLPAIRR